MLRPEDLPAAEIELLGPTGSIRIDTLVADIVEQSRGADDIRQSEAIGMAMLRLRKFMFDRVYLGATARSEHARVERTMTGLFDHYLAHPERSRRATRAPTPLQRVTDYIAGMTDRFCISRSRRLAIPEQARF